MRGLWVAKPNNEMKIHSHTQAFHAHHYCSIRAGKHPQSHQQGASKRVPIVYLRVLLITFKYTSSVHAFEWKAIYVTAAREYASSSNRIMQWDFFSHSHSTLLVQKQWGVCVVEHACGRE
jgi:hypothetical protein